MLLISRLELRLLQIYRPSVESAILSHRIDISEDTSKCIQIVTVFHPRGKSQNLQIQSGRIQYYLLARLAFKFIAWYHALVRNLQTDR